MKRKTTYFAGYQKRHNKEFKDTYIKNKNILNKY